MAISGDDESLERTLAEDLQAAFAPLSRTLKVKNDNVSHCRLPQTAPADDLTRARPPARLPAHDQYSRGRHAG